MSGTHQRAERGMSSFELLAVVTIIGIVGAVAVPNLREMWKGMERRNIREQLEFDLKRAKQTAAAEGARGILSLSVGVQEYRFGMDYPPYSDPPVADQDQFTTIIPDNATLSFGQTIIFDARGFHVDKFGDLTTTGISLSYDGVQFLNATLYPTGIID